MEAREPESGQSELRNRRGQESVAVQPRAGASMLELSRTPGLNLDVWRLIAKKLSFKDLLNLRKSWAWLYHDPLIAAEFLKAWCLAIPAEFAGEIKEDVDQILNYCFEAAGVLNSNKVIEVLSKLDKSTALDVTNNPVDTSIVRLLENRTAEGDRARSILSSVLKTILTSPNKVDISPQAFIAQEEWFKSFLRKMPMVGAGISASGLLWQIMKTINTARGVIPNEGPAGHLFPRFIIMAGAAVVSFPYAQQAGFFDRCRHAGFWRKVQRLQDREENQSPQLEALANSNRFRFSSLFNVGGGLTILAFLLLLTNIARLITQAYSDNASARPGLGNNGL